jgi:N-methylhydantoinase B
MTVCRMTDVIFGCLSQAVPDRVRACSSGMQGVSFSGRRKSDGSAYVYLELFCGGMGARPTKDGVDYIETDITNMMNAPTEAVELEYPLRVHSMRLAPDSGGAGRYRGGLGMAKVFEVVDGPLEVTHRGDRHVTQPYGLNGGLPAGSWSSLIRRTDGATHKVKSRERFTLRTGDVLDCVTAGGGGYGDPLARPAQAVLEDLRDHRITRAALEEAYGVVLDAAGEVDAAATAARRAALGAERGEITWTFDCGALGRI